MSETYTRVVPCGVSGDGSDEVVFRPSTVVCFSLRGAAPQSVLMQHGDGLVSLEGCREPEGFVWVKSKDLQEHGI
jgi:hypothetical protein